MNYKAIVFGSIGVIAETSELQRQCFNDALEEAGVERAFEAETYRELLQDSGGRRRLASLLRSTEEDPAVIAIHRRKTARFQERLREGNYLKPDFGVFVQHASTAGITLAIASTTYAATIAALLEQGSKVSATDFKVILSSDDVEHPKPAPDVYIECCARLGVSPHEVLVFEDSVPSVEAALGAGVACCFMPGEFHRGRSCDGVASTYTSFAEAAQDLLP
ncbi:MAG: HAD-IA family hydrolase [Pseudomonadota bacterium]